MAPRAYWKGSLKLSLVSCPVALYSAKHDRGNIHFNLINPKTGTAFQPTETPTGVGASSDLSVNWKFT